MWLAKITISCWNEDWKAFLARQTEESWSEVLKELGDVLSLPEWPPLLEGGIAQYMQYTPVEALATQADVQKIWNITKCQVAVSRVRGLFQEEHPGQQLKDAQILMREATQVSVHIPGALSLWSIKNVTVLEDACTTHLQDMLNEGWRIVAVCPPNDSRRPTYVIGKE